MNHRPFRRHPARLHAFFLILAAFVLIPSLARANAGTALMWASIFHLLFGNLVIGLVEGLLVGLVFRAPIGRAIGCMIAANYFSAACGVFAILPLFSRYYPALLGANPLRTGLLVIWGLVALLVVLTVLLEWPFCFLTLRGRSPRPWRLALLASLAAQAVSYAVLIPFYIRPSSATVLNRTKVESDLGFSKNPKASVYYLGGDGALWRRRLDGSPAVKTLDLAGGVSWRDMLKPLRSGDGKSWDLFLVRSQIERHPSQVRQASLQMPTSATQCLIGNFATRAAEWKRDRSPEDAFFDFGPALDLRPAKERQWECNAGFWAFDGLKAWRGGGTWRDGHGEKLWLSMETPILKWLTRSVTLLPGDQAVYQLGDDMIVLLDLNTRQLALVARGHGPAVGLDE